MKATCERRWKRFEEDFGARFWAWVDKSGGEDACWPWLGKIAKRGYGRFQLGRKSHFAHRKALALTAGEPSEVGLFALHSCDNPPCCNPRHLRWGTAAENSADRRLRGRDRTGRAKIDLGELLQLRSQGLSYSALAAHFAVNQASIGKALKREDERLKALIAQEEERDGAPQKDSTNPQREDPGHAE